MDLGQYLNWNYITFFIIIFVYFLTVYKLLKVRDEYYYDKVRAENISKICLEVACAENNSDESEIVRLVVKRMKDEPAAYKEYLNSLAPQVRNKLFEHCLHRLSLGRAEAVTDLGHIPDESGHYLGSEVLKRRADSFKPYEELLYMLRRKA